MEMHQAYHKVNLLVHKMSEMNAESNASTDPEVKQAYSTIIAVNQSTLTTLHAQMVLNMSTMVGNIKLPDEIKSQQ